MEHAESWRPCSALALRLRRFLLGSARPTSLEKDSLYFSLEYGSSFGALSAGYGNLLTSPFAVAFLDNVLPGLLSDADRDFSRTFLVHYTESAFGRNQGEAKSVLKKLSSTETDRFHKSDWAMIRLLSELSDPAFSREMDSLVEAYRGALAFHPVSLLLITTQRTANPPSATNFFARSRIASATAKRRPRLMLASDLVLNSFDAGRRKKVESIYGWRHDMQRQVAKASNLRNGLCRASDSS